MQNYRCIRFYSYRCVYPKKLIVPKADLTSQTDANIKTNLTTTCKATGDFDIDITAYTCTRPCPLPRISDTTMMAHNWTNTTDNAEFRDVAR